jgi:uncharacterized protein DUF6262
MPMPMPAGRRAGGGGTTTALVRDGQPVTIARLAATAGVSRSWIYTTPELLDRIETLAHDRPRPARNPIPANQRAGTASLQRRLELAHQRVRQLADENQRLHDELARAYGQLRDANT